MLEYNWKNASSAIVGEHGIAIEQEFENNKDRIANIIRDIYQKKHQPGQWKKWMNLPYYDDTVWFIKEYASEVKGKFDNLLIIGTGGSSLGGKAITEALLKPYWNLLSEEERESIPRVFFLDNVDPDQINGLLNILDLEKTLVNVITKSGQTAETMASYMIIKEKLESELGRDYRKNIVATTDKNVGVLRQLAEQEGYKTFEVPDDVSGRFSVLSAVGLLPLCLLGIDIEELLRGVRDIDEILQNPDIYQNPAAQNALIHYLMDTQKKKHITVMMPYSNKLRYLSDWFVQLWAESLGKEYDMNGNKINNGPTPIKAVGATDQHSQLQLYCEGPNDKVINFVRVAKSDTELEIPKLFEYTGVGYMSGKSLNELMGAEANSTKVALCDYNRPNVTITIPKVNEYYLGQLLYFFMIQTAIAGALYNIDALSQSEGEQVKNYIYALMGRVGYEESARILKEKMAEA